MFQAPRFPDTQSFIAIALVVAMIALTFIMAFVKVPDSDVFKMLTGGLMTVGFATIVNFYFGSSTGSKSKDDAMSNAVTALFEQRAAGDAVRRGESGRQGGRRSDRDLVPVVVRSAGDGGEQCAGQAATYRQSH